MKITNYVADERDKRRIFHFFILQNKDVSNG